MKLFLMPRELSWWIWLITATVLALGLAGVKAAFPTAILLSFVQTAWQLWQHRSLKPYPVQIRAAYTALLVVCLTPFLRRLYWLPAVGTFALVLFGYCLMARTLSLMPWNRTEPLTLGLARRALFTPPVLGRDSHGLPAIGETMSVCELEARAALMR